MSRYKITEDGNLRWKVTTAPSIEPVTASEVKTYARIDGSSEDSLIESFIKAVRIATERYLGRALIEQTITARMDEFSNYNSEDLKPLYAYAGSDVVIELPRPPLISVTSVSTLDEDDTKTTYASSNYFVRTIPEPGQLVIRDGSTPPINTDRYFGGYEIIYKAGYGDEATDVEEAIRLGIIMWVADIYENRVPISEPPGIVDTIMAPFRIINV